MITENQLLKEFENSYYEESRNSEVEFLRQRKAGTGDKLQESISRAQTFAESLYKKYDKYIGDMPNDWTKRNVAVQLDNYAKATKRLSESTKTNVLATFDKYAFPLIRMVLPTMATNKAFSIQSMFGPTSQIFYFDYVYGTTRGNITAGQKLFENFDPNYGNSDVSLETLGQGNGSTTSFSLVLSHAPVVPGTVTIETIDGSDNELTLTDDGQGNLVGDTGGTSTVNYTTGQLTIVYSAAPKLDEVISANYSVASEGNEAGIPEVDLLLTVTPVVARSTKLRMRWSMEADYALRDTVGLQAEAELVNAAAADIAYRIDQNNFGNVKRVALDKRNDTDYQFDLKKPTGVSFTEHKHEIVDYLIKGSSYILSQSGRAIGTWLNGHEEMTNVIESLSPRFVPNANIPATRGILELGVLDGRWTIFKDLRMEYREYMMGFKGSEFLHAGYVWAPWITAFMTPTSLLDDMQNRKGIGSLYGQKIVNPRMYLRMKVIRTS